MKGSVPAGGEILRQESGRPERHGIDPAMGHRTTSALSEQQLAPSAPPSSCTTIRKPPVCAHDRRVVVERSRPLLVGSRGGMNRSSACRTRSSGGRTDRAFVWRRISPPTGTDPSRPVTSTWSVSRSASTPPRPPASSCSTSSARSRTSSVGLSPNAPATELPRRGNEAERRVDRHLIRKRFLRLRNSSKPVCRPQEQQNSSELAGQRLTESPPSCA